MFPDLDDTTKPEVNSKLVGTWESLKMILYHKYCNLHAPISTHLAAYFGLMETTWDFCEANLLTELNANKDGKSLPIPRGEEYCRYCTDGATKVIVSLQKCPRCYQPYMHEPPSNKEIHRKSIYKLSYEENAVIDQ